MSFSVITNGCDVRQKSQIVDIRLKYSIHKNVFLFVFVGNVNTNKNQRQVVDAFCLIDEQVRKNIKVIFAGGGDWKQLADYIAEKKLDSNLIVCGPIAKEDIHNYYLAADATILTSLSEGFGLSIIEGFVYGLPCLTFANLPAVKNLYSPDSMLLCEFRDTHRLAECMLKMVDIDWDKNAIIEHSKQFSLQNMADRYINLYRDSIK